MTFARIREASKGLAADGWCFFVLTLDREGTYSGSRPWKTTAEAYRDLSAMSRKFMKRLRRLFKRFGWASFENHWVATVEAHRTGWPHVNLLIHSPDLAAYLRYDNAARKKNGASADGARWLDGDLLEAATGSGWGRVSTAEAARNDEAAQGYLVKIAALADRTNGEIAKLTQLPMNAPDRFRRLRAGKGFLPPRRKNPEVTGTLVRRYTDYDGTPVVVPLHKVSAELADAVVDCCYRETALAEYEQSTHHQYILARGLWPALARAMRPFVSVFKSKGVNENGETKTEKTDPRSARSSHGSGALARPDCSGYRRPSEGSQLWLGADTS